MMKGLRIAFAHGINGEFGNKGGLPWGAPLKEDMKAFVEFTKDCVLVMGRNTFESLPRNLNDHGRVTAVVCNQGVPQAKNGDKPDSVILLDGEQLIDMLKTLRESYDKDVVVIGGAALLESIAWYAEEVLCTTISTNHKMQHDIATHLCPEYIEALPTRYYKRNGLPVEEKLTEVNKKQVLDMGRNTSYEIRHYKHMDT